MFRPRSRKVHRPRLSRCLSILLLKCMSPIPPTPTFPSPAPTPSIFSSPHAAGTSKLPHLLLRSRARSNPHRPPWETVAPPHSSLFHGTTPNWSCTPMYISQARSFCSLLRRLRDHQRLPRFRGTSAVHAAGAAWTSASRRHHRHVAMNDAARASLGVYGGCYRHPPLPS
jgi:hypothetical protein